MKDLVEFLAKNIVEKEKEVFVEESHESGNYTLKLKVDPSDMGKVIGKEGKVIKSIRTLLKIKAIREGKRAYLELQEQN